MLSGVGHNLGVDIVGDHLDDGECRPLDLVGLECWEGAEEFVGTGREVSFVTARN